jgi:hypothetical protein
VKGLLPVIDVLKKPSAMIFKRTSRMKIPVQVMSSHLIRRVDASDGSFTGLKRRSKIKLIAMTPLKINLNKVCIFLYLMYLWTYFSFSYLRITEM